MSWDDFLDEFENLTVCHLESQSEMERRVTGQFIYGVNSPENLAEFSAVYLDSTKHFQFRLDVEKDGLVKFQLLLGQFSNLTGILTLLFRLFSTQTR